MSQETTKPTTKGEQDKVSTDSQAEFQVSRWKAYFWFGIIWLTMALDYADRQAVAALLPILKKEFMLTDAQGGGLMSALTVSLGIFVFPIALLMDKWGRGKLIAVMVFVWSLATWVTGMCKNYGQLLTARAVVGVGEAGYGPASAAFISTWFPKTLRGRMNGLFTTAIVFGNSAGIAFVGYLAYNHGWKSVFGVLTIPGIILALLFWFMPDYKAAKVDDGQPKAPKVKVLDVIKYVVSSKALLAVYLLGSAQYCVQMSIVSWAPSYFARTFGMNVKEAGAVVAVMGLCAAIGPVLFGYLGDYFLKKHPRGRIITNVTLAILMCVALITALNSKEFMIVCVFWSLAWAMMAGIVVNNAATCQDLSPVFMRASVFSLIAVCNHLIGSSIGPLLSGILSDKIGLKLALMYVGIGSTVVMLIALFIMHAYFNRDLEKMRAMGTFTLKSSKE